MKKVILGLVVVVAWLYSTSSFALTCGATARDNKICVGTANQFAGGFAPTGTQGGFGGATSCVATKTPVVFIHGNADSAISFDAPPKQVAGYTAPPHSMYAELKAQGYKDCELFGVTYLTTSEQDSTLAQYNYHKESYDNTVTNFITAVLAYTGKTKVDIIAHSFGVTVSMSALKYNAKWSKVNKFIAISAGMRGLGSCYYTGYMNAYAPVCGSQNIFDQYVFGFWPDGWAGASNTWTGATSSNSFRKAPSYNTAVSFYSIGSARKDHIACTATYNVSTCGDTQLFNAYANVLSQLNVGMGTEASVLDYNWSDGYIWNQAGGDTDGVGHYLSKSNTGKIVYQMLNSTCTGAACATTYTVHGTATAR